MFHSQNRGVQENVLSTGEFSMKAGPDFEQAADPASQLNTAPRGAKNSSQDLEQRRLAGAISPDDSDHISGLGIEADVVERQKARTFSLRRLGPTRDEKLVEHSILMLSLAECKLLAQTTDGNGLHTCSAKSASKR
jgi:hypothetical protein